LNIRKLLANSNRESWGIFILPMILGIYFIMPFGIFLPIVLPLSIWLKLLLFLVDLTGIGLYLRLTGFIISMGSLYGRPNFFKKGDFVTYDGKKYFEVIETDSQFFWLEENWINSPDNSWKMK